MGEGSLSPNEGESGSRDGVPENRHINDQPNKSESGSSGVLSREALDDEQIEFIGETRDYVKKWAQSSQEGTSPNPAADMLLAQVVHRVLKENDGRVTRWCAGDQVKEFGEAIVGIFPSQDNLIATIFVSHTYKPREGQPGIAYLQTRYHMHIVGDQLDIEKVGGGMQHGVEFKSTGIAPSGEEILELKDHIEKQHRYGKKMRKIN